MFGASASSRSVTFSSLSASFSSVAALPVLPLAVLVTRPPASGPLLLAGRVHRDPALQLITGRSGRRTGRVPSPLTRGPLRRAAGPGPPGRAPRRPGRGPVVVILWDLGPRGRCLRHEGPLFLRFCR